jgi:hypothetical protein
VRTSGVALPSTCPTGWPFGVSTSAGATRRGVLVQPVGRVAPGPRRGPAPLVQVVVGPGSALELAQLVARVRVPHLLRRRRQEVLQVDQGALGVIAALDGGAVAQRHLGAPAQVIVGVAGQIEVAVFLDHARPVRRVVAGS